MNIQPQQRKSERVRPRIFAIACVLGGGAALRFWNITAGLPYRIGVDEPVIAEHAIGILKSGDFNPHFFDYPGLYIYAQTFVAGVRFMTGATNGLWQSLNQFWPEHLFPWTRALNAGLGTLTLFVTYRAGVRWGLGVAVVTAALFAVWPNHVRESHFALTDVPLTLLTTLAWLCSLRALETGWLGWYSAAGANVGLAAATKYPGAVALVMPLVAAAVTQMPWTSRLQCAIAATGAALAAFLMGAPYSLLDLPGFLNAFGYLATAYQPRPFVDGAQIYLGHLRVAVGWPGTIVIFVGIVWCAARAVFGRDTKSVVSLTFPVAYFFAIATKNLILGRYLLPIIPFLCLFMAIIMIDLMAWVLRLRTPWWMRSVGAMLFIAMVVYHPVRQGIDWPRQYGKRTTQDVAYRMIRQFVPTGGTVAVERSVLRLPDSVYRAVNVTSLTDRSSQKYLSAGTFIIASSDAFGQVLANPDAQPDTYRAYRRLFDEANECLPTVEPTPEVSGPQIRICRLLGSNTDARRP